MNLNFAKTVDLVPGSGSDGSGPHDCEWSPDGKHIAIALSHSVGDDVVSVYEYNSDSNTLSLLDSSADQAGGGEAVKWSRDGRFIFAGYEGGIRAFSFNGSSLATVGAIVSENASFPPRIALHPSERFAGIAIEGAVSDSLHLHRINHAVLQAETTLDNAVVNLRKDMILSNLNLKG